MVERFQGEHNRRRLVDVLLDQCIVRQDLALAEAIASKAELIEYKSGDDIIRQGEEDQGIVFIIAGSVSIRKHDREITTYYAGNHVGELATIDPTKPRAATVRATATTVVVCVSEPDFSALADEYPKLWRRLALECAERLRERGNLVRQRNDIPILFIGSSSEALPIAREIESGLSHDNVRVKLWTSTFTPSLHPIEVLEKEMEAADFAVLVLGEDDIVQSRDTTLPTPRDNVIFELGLFMGALKRHRVFMIQPRGIKLKLPSDLAGLTPIEYATDDSRPLVERVSPACNELRKLIAAYGAI